MPPRPLVGATTLLPAGSQGRVAARTARRTRRRRTRSLVALAIVVTVALIAGVVVIGLGHRHHAHAVAAPVAGTQHTLLLGIGALNGSAESVELYGVDPTTGDGANLLILPDTVVAGPGATVGGSFSLSPTTQFTEVVADLLNVRVDYTWRLSPQGLADLVNQLGGVTVNVDEQIATSALALNAGSQKLTGAEASAYALYLGTDPEPSRANRTRLVFDGIMAALPKSTSALTALIGSLGANTELSTPPATLAGFLQQLAASSVLDNEQDVPVTTLDTGGLNPEYDVTQPATSNLIASEFGGSRISSGSGVGTRVEVINDSGRPDLAASAEGQLQAAGLTFVRAINDVPFHRFTHSVILIPSATTANIDLGHRVAAALGIPNAQIEINSEDESVADAIAVLANDYKY